MITAELLRTILRYDQDTGDFYWLKARSKGRVGMLAGSKNSRGYILIRFFKRGWPAHRLAWLYVYGKWPDGEIDHIDRNKTNNRLANLRDTSHTGNSQNRIDALSNNKSGLLGVTRDHRCRAKPWRASIKVGGNSIHIGMYQTKEEAHQAYLAAKRDVHDLPIQF